MIDIQTGVADEMLVSLFAQGSEKAFNTLFERHRQRLYNYIFFYVRHAQQTEDILQDVLLKAVSTIRKGLYQENGRFSQWITRIARNMVIDYLRQQQTWETTSTDDENFDCLNNLKYAEETIEKKMEQEQVLQDVRRMVTFLPAEQKEVVVMHYYNNLSFKEIAQMTGVSINTSLGRMHYALLNMRKMAREHVSLC